MSRFVGRIAAGALVLGTWSCGGSDTPLAPTALPAAASSSAARTSGSSGGVHSTAEDFYILVVQCQPKGDKRAHFEVAPAAGGGPTFQLRCKGMADVRGPGPWSVRPMADTDASYRCSPAPITVKLKKEKNRVVCSR